jgi:hypothetical protein
MIPSKMHALLISQSIYISNWSVYCHKKNDKSKEEGAIANKARFFKIFLLVETVFL